MKRLDKFIHGKDPKRYKRVEKCQAKPEKQESGEPTNEHIIWDTEWQVPICGRTALSNYREIDPIMQHSGQDSEDAMKDWPIVNNMGQVYVIHEDWEDPKVKEANTLWERDVVEWNKDTRNKKRKPMNVDDYHLLRCRLEATCQRLQTEATTIESILSLLWAKLEKEFRFDTTMDTDGYWIHLWHMLHRDQLKKCKAKLQKAKNELAAARVKEQALRSEEIDRVGWVYI